MIILLTPLNIFAPNSEINEDILFRIIKIYLCLHSHILKRKIGGAHFFEQPGAQVYHKTSLIFLFKDNVSIIVIAFGL